MKKKVTIYDIAKETGVSVGTVNRALNNKPRISPATKKSILDTAKRMGYKVNPAAQGLRRATIKIGAILFCPIDEYVNSIIDGIVSSADDLEKYNVVVDVKKIPYTDSKNPLIHSEELINYFSANDYNGIILFLSSTINDLKPISKLINQLAENNIHFATVANDIPDSNRVIHVGVDAYMAGKMAAEVLYMTCSEKDVALLVTSKDSPVNIEYINGFTDYANTHKFSQISIYEHYDDKNKVIEITKKMIQENPDLKGIYMATASSALACEHIKKMNKRGVSIITTDLLPETPALLHDKTVSCAIFQNPYRQGRNVVKLLYNYITTKNDSGSHLIAPHILLSSNLSAYEEKSNM